MLGRYVDLGNPVANHPLNDGLVSWWLPLRNNQGGTTLFDLRRRYNGTLTSGPTWATGPSGFQALSFDGSDDYVDQPGVMATGDFTFACRFLTNTVGGFQRITGIAATSGSNNRLDVYLRDSSPAPVRADVYNSTGTPTTVDTSASVSAGTWYLYVLSVSSGATNAYLNLASATGAGVTRNGDSGNRRLGTDPSNANLFLGGRIESAWWWSRALSALDVAQLYGQAQLGYPDTLKRWSRRTWLLGETPAAGGSSIIPKVMHLNRMRAG